VRVGQRKYIESPVEELYLLDDDPREGPGHNVAERHPDEVTRLSEALRDLVDRPLRGPRLESTVESLDPEVIQRLRALGYLAAPTLETPQWAPEDDLKHRLALYNRFLRAIEQIGAGETAAGVGRLLEVLAVDPDNPRCLWLLAEAVATDPIEAGEGLTRLEAVARDPTLDPAMRAPFLVNCGRARLILDRPRTALTFFREAADLEPDAAVNWSWLCVAHVHLGEVAEALVAAQEAVNRSPDTTALQVQLGLMQIISGQLGAGAQTWAAVLADADHPVTTWDIAGLCANDARIANLSFERLHRVSSDGEQPTAARAAARAAVGKMLLNAGRHEAALQALDEAAELAGGGDVGGLWLRAWALVFLGRLPEAEQLLRQAYEQDPHDIRIVVDLANVCAGQDRGAEAIELLSAYHRQLAKFATARRPSSAAFADTLGQVHLTRRDGESAVAALSRAVSLQPDNAGYQYHLGLAYRLDHRPDEARAAFAAAVELAPTPRPAWFDDAVEGAARE
jgi:tetratricopeptide (TPR) repeat protein